jgi:hypothetical protein
LSTLIFAGAARAGMVANAAMGAKEGVRQVHGNVQRSMGAAISAGRHRAACMLVPDVTAAFCPPATTGWSRQGLAQSAGCSELRKPTRVVLTSCVARSSASMRAIKKITSPGSDATDMPAFSCSSPCISYT